MKYKILGGKSADLIVIEGGINRHVFLFSRKQPSLVVVPENTTFIAYFSFSKKLGWFHHRYAEARKRYSRYLNLMVRTANGNELIARDVYVPVNSCITGEFEV